MSRRTCSNSKPRVSIWPSASAQNMNASSGSGLWPSLISTAAEANRSGAERPRLLPTEEPALERAQALVALEWVRRRRDPVLLRDAEIGVERRVRVLERVVELIPLEHVVVAARLVGPAVLRVDDTADRPDAALLALDPDDHLLLGA